MVWTTSTWIDSRRWSARICTHPVDEMTGEASQLWNVQDIQNPVADTALSEDECVRTDGEIWSEGGVGSKTY